MQRAPDRPNSKYSHVYPIVRIDTPIDHAAPTQKITDAEAEVSRLSEVNTDKSCLYSYCTSRLIEQGQ